MFSEEFLIQKVNVKLLNLFCYLLIEKCLHQQKNYTIKIEIVWWEPNSWEDFIGRLIVFIPLPVTKIYGMIDTKFPKRESCRQFNNWKQRPSRIKQSKPGQYLLFSESLVFKFCSISYDHIHNIFRLFNGWVNFLFAKNETKRGY